MVCPAWLDLPPCFLVGHADGRAGPGLLRPGVHGDRPPLPFRHRHAVRNIPIYPADLLAVELDRLENVQREQRVSCRPIGSGATVRHAPASSARSARQHRGSNQAAFDKAVEDDAAAATALIGALLTKADPRDRQVEVLRVKASNAVRFQLGE